MLIKELKKGLKIALRDEHDQLKIAGPSDDMYPPPTHTHTT
jgi:hypothetical protein